MAKRKVTKAQRRALDKELGFDTTDPAAIQWEAWKMLSQIDQFLGKEAAGACLP